MTEIENTLNYAFLDENDIVINVAVFESHNIDFLETIRVHFNAKEWVACIDFDNQISMGDHRHNGKFYPPQPSSDWIRDEEKGEWILPINP
jgi:hypothetical protein